MIGEGWAQSGLVGLWHLNGNSNDSSGNGNNGTDTAITYSQANGKFGQGAGCNGTSSKIVLPNSSVLKPTSNFSVSAWIKFTTGVTAAVCMESQGYGGTYYYGYVFGQHTDTTGKLRLFTGNNTSSQGQITTDLAYNNGLWHFAVATMSGTTASIYVDGLLVKSGTLVVPTYAGTPTIQIGSDVGVNQWNGSIDEVAIFNVAKDAKWVRQQYALGRGLLV